MHRITIRFSKTSQEDPKTWKDVAKFDVKLKDEDEAEKAAIRVFKQKYGDVPYTVERNAEIRALHAKARLLASTEDPMGEGVVFDTLIDGEPSAAEPSVQKVTKNDGGIQEAPEQRLLTDDLVVPSIKFG